MMAPIESYAKRWGSGIMAALRLLAAHYESRPDPGYQGGEVHGLLKEKTGVTDQELRNMVVCGLIVQSAACFDGEVAVEERWAYIISPVGQQLLERELMYSRLVSIATAEPQTEQAGWMIATARDGLAWGPDDPAPASTGEQ